MKKLLLLVLLSSPLVATQPSVTMNTYLAQEKAEQVEKKSEEKTEQKDKEITPAVALVMVAGTAVWYGVSYAVKSLFNN